MARGRARRGNDHGEFWPGYVDMLSTLLLVMTFLMSLFMLAQYLATQESAGKDSALQRLTRQISELTTLLSLETGKSKSASDELAALQASLATLQSENTKLSGEAALGGETTKVAEGTISKLTTELESQKVLSSDAVSKVDALNQQLAALRTQIAALNEALDASEKKTSDNDKTIKDLGVRLNAALAKQVQELQRYRSDFFGRLRDLLKDRDDIRVVGDRFVFQSEVLFGSGDAALSAGGLTALDQMAAAIVDLERQIPKEIEWSLQVDGHTDARPINSATYPSNWELSSARAASVVKYMISKGVPPNRLVAAGFGEFQPLETGNDDASLQKNRRIELKLTNR